MGASAWHPAVETHSARVLAEPTTLAELKTPLELTLQAQLLP